MTPCEHFTVPPPTFSGEATKPLDLQGLSTDRGANDIDDSVLRADLVKVNSLDLDTVDLGLGIAQRAKDITGRALGLLTDRGRSDDAKNLLQMATMLVLCVATRSCISRIVMMRVQNSSRGMSFSPRTMTSILVAEIPAAIYARAAPAWPQCSAQRLSSPATRTELQRRPWRPETCRH